jgi:hypothetical protein
LVREFSEYLEVVFDEDEGIIVQTYVQSHMLQIDPQVISDVIDVPVLPISTSPFSKDMELPTLEQLREYFNAHPQGHERAHAFVKINAFSPPHRLLAKIVLHNLWPTALRSELVLKRAQFLYALCMTMHFCLCKNILNLMLEMRDEHNTGLHFACLITRLIIQSVIDVSSQLMMRIQDPLGSQTLMKSNAQLRYEGQDDAPLPPLVQVEIPTGASSSQIAPPS